MDTRLLMRQPWVWIFAGIEVAASGVLFVAVGDGVGYALIAVGVIAALLALVARMDNHRRSRDLEVLIGEDPQVRR